MKVGQLKGLKPAVMIIVGMFFIFLSHSESRSTTLRFVLCITTLGGYNNAKIYVNIGQRNSSEFGNAQYVNVIF